MEKGLLSIILPVHNSEKYLKQCFENLISITYINKEIIVIDDGSTDRSPLICDDFAQRYPFIKVYHNTNQGVQNARQFALQHINGEYVAFFDTDDGIDLNAYEKCIEVMNSQNADVVVFDFVNEYQRFSICSNNETPIKPHVFNSKQEIYDHFQRYDDLSFEGFLWNKIWKRKILEEKDFRTDLYLCSDVVFVWEILKDVQNVCFIEPKFYHYLYSPTSITKKSNIYRFSTALKAWKYLVDEMEMVDTKSKTKIVASYIVWNIKYAEHLPLIGEKADLPDWEEIKRNIWSHKKYIKNISIYYRILANSLFVSKYIFKIESMIINYLKSKYKGAL